MHVALAPGALASPSDDDSDWGDVAEAVETTRRDLSDHPGEQEERRLALLEQLQDPGTRRRIEALGIGLRARCLEVGAGRGSIARWLADRVAPAGSVVAIDRELSFLAENGRPNLEAHRQDVLVDEPPGGPFDFIHCRAVLMHIPERRRALERMASWLAPGGWILCEEPDWAFALTSPREIWLQTFLAYQQALPTMDLACGRALVGEIGRLGLEQVTAEVDAHMVCGGSPEAEWYALWMLAVREPVLDSGAMSQAEFDHAQAVVGESEFCEPGFLFVRAQGRSPHA